MNTRIDSFSIALVACLVFAGCNQNWSGVMDVGPANPAPENAGSMVAFPEQPRLEDLPVVPRAEFVNWSKFPVGTVVTLVRETNSDVDKVVVTTTTRLIEKSEERVLIESQVTVDRGGTPLENPPMQAEFKASFRLPPNMVAEKFALPDQNAVAKGTETISIDGVDYGATRYEWNGSSEAGTTQNVIWMSPEAPGRVLRHEMKCSAFVSQEKVQKIEIPKP
jgi:hypothetical protein